MEKSMLRSVLRSHMGMPTSIRIRANSAAPERIKSISDQVLPVTRISVGKGRGGTIRVMLDNGIEFSTKDSSMIDEIVIGV